MRRRTERWTAALLVAAAASVLSGCMGLFGVRMVPLDDATMARHVTRVYRAPATTCYEATLRALKELDIPVSEQNPATGAIVTTRKEYEATTTITQGNNVQQIRAREAYKYYLRVNEALTKKECVVRAARFRLWHNGRELREINLPFAQPRIWEPLFREIGEELRRRGG